MNTPTTPAIEAIAAEQQAAFGEHDTWQNIISDWIATRFEGQPFTLEQVFIGCLGCGERHLISKPDQNRAAACLKRLGFRRKRETIEGIRAYWWQKHQDSGALKKLGHLGQLGQQEAFNDADI